MQLGLTVGVGQEGEELRDALVFSGFLPPITHSEAPMIEFVARRQRPDNTASARR